MIDDRFESLLQREIGLDAASIGSTSIDRAVRERFAALAGKDAMRAAGPLGATLTRVQSDLYWLELCTSSEERQRLVEAVVVPETWFFRDREAFAALAKLARERHARWPDRRLRLLSLPCSSGEEPYSIAMTLLDAGLPAEAFAIDAIDVSERAMTLGTRAVYGRNAFRGHLLEFRDRHFTQVAEGWQLAAPVCNTVRFTRMNLFDAALRANAPYDFVFCRNLLIYFDRDDQARAVDALEALLASDGTLFVGPSETGALFRHAMHSARIPLAFAFHKSPPEVPTARTAPRRTIEPIKMRASIQDYKEPGSPARSSSSPYAFETGLRMGAVPALAKRNPGGNTSTRASNSANASSGAGMTVTLNPPVQGAYGRPAESAAERRANQLAAALHLANLGRLREATIAADTHLDSYGPSAEVFYLLGLIADADGRGADASVCYRKTLYLDPRHYEALTHLATLLELQGDHAGAHLLSERAARANSVRIVHNR